MATEEFEGEIRLIHRGGAECIAKWDKWHGEDKGTCRASCWLDLGPMKGRVVFTLGSGWGARPLQDWRIHKDDLAALRLWAREQCHREIHPMPRSTGRKRRPKTGKKPHPRQTSLFE